MSILFPEWTNSLPRMMGAVGGVMSVGVVAVVTYWFTPKFWEVGYEPDQPVDYNHQLHAGQLGIDCRYCHTHVEESGHSNVPDTATCMNCHTGKVGLGGYLSSTLWSVHETDPNLVSVRGAYESGEPIRWKRIHKLPDYVQFNHSVHINAGVSCYSCHGRIDQLEVVRQEHSLAMAWCLDCHRNPQEHLVEVSDIDPSLPRITDLARIEELLKRQAQSEAGMEIVRSERIQPPQNCGACHY